MRTSKLSAFIRPVMLFPLAMSLTLAGCGDEKKKEDEDEGSKEKAEVVKFTSGSAEVGFEGAAADQQFVLMPISLGDPATIQGATDETLTFTIAAASGGGTFHLRPSASAQALTMTPAEREHSIRTLLNHYDPARGEAQPEWFFRLARRIDQSTPGAALLEGMGPVERYYRKTPAARERANLTVTTAGECPAAGGDVTILDVEDPTEPDIAPVPAGGAVSGDDYCIVYLSDPVTAGTKAEVEATIKTTIERYKMAIYKDDFAAIGGYTFKPVVVVMDFGNPAVWPQSQQIAGAFVGAMSTEAKMPMLYMAADLQKVSPYKGQTNYDKAAAKLAWHSTIAHEMQHAVINYFRTRVTSGGTDDTPAIDEGIAHYMEDLFGYGEEGFGGFAKAYLDTWAVNANPPLHATESGQIERGGAQSFLYYLISQKGGVTFTDGVVSGGGGLDFLVEVVKNAGTKKGPANLQSKFGGDWLTTVANFFGALVLDGTETLTADKTLTVQEPQTISDMNGGTDKVYGMRFNGFGGREKSIDWSKWESKVGTTTEVEGSYYATTPVLYTVTDPAAKVTITTTSDAANTAVIKVRVK